jgi:Fe-Mn family superoxide dismutase
MNKLTRRQAIKTAAIAGTAFAALPAVLAQPAEFPAPKPVLISTAPEPFTLPPLPYAYDALEPFIDAQTMQIHHDKHHAAYVANLNKAWQKMDWNGPLPNFEHLKTNWLKNSKFLSENPAIRNNGGGHFNHFLFWQMMKKDGGGPPTGELAKAIDAHFGNFSAFKEGLTKAALGQFGSGWAWLVLDGKSLKISATPNQDTPLVTGQIPLLGVDVWEHAYYLKYQNKRADYVSAWFNVVNWDFVSGRYAKFIA